MQVGSLVELIGNDWKYNYPEVVYPVKGVVYTVREIATVSDSLLLEEIINRIEPLQLDSGKIIVDEIHFSTKRFRELQPPMDISELVEESISLSNKSYA